MTSRAETPDARAHVLKSESQTPSGSTPPPDDVEITQDLVAYCFAAGAPAPTREHVLKFLANARSKGFVFADWGERFKLWMLNEKRRRDRDRNGNGNGNGNGTSDAACTPYHQVQNGDPLKDPNADPFERQQRALKGES